MHGAQGRKIHRKVITEMMHKQNYGADNFIKDYANITVPRKTNRTSISLIIDASHEKTDLKVYFLVTGVNCFLVQLVSIH